MSDTTNPSSEEPTEASESTTDATEQTSVTFDTLLDRLDKVQADLANRNWWANFGNISTVIVGGGLVALMLGYFTFGYVQIKDLTDSRMLYALLEDSLRVTKMPGSNSSIPTTLSQARKYLEREIEQNSKKLAEQMSEQLLARAPEMRRQIESYVIDQVQQVLDKGSQMTEQKFRDIIDNNRELIELCIDDLAKDDVVAQERLDQLVAAMEHELQADLKGQADEVLDTVQFANQWLDGLSDGVGLSREKQLERQFVMILHRIQLEQVDPSLKDREYVSDADRARASADEGQTKDVVEAVTDTDEGTSDKPADKPEDKPADKLADKPADRPADKPSDKPEDKPADKPEDKPEDKPADKPADKPSDTPKKDDSRRRFVFSEKFRSRGAPPLAATRFVDALRTDETATGCEWTASNSCPIAVLRDTLTVATFARTWCFRPLATRPTEAPRHRGCHRPARGEVVDPRTIGRGSRTGLEDR